MKKTILIGLIADMMGHDADINLKSYARFQTKDLEKASDLALLS